LFIRLPNWSSPKQGSDRLYQLARGFIYVQPIIMINGKGFSYKIENGYAVIEREWNKGDVVTTGIPMEIQKLTAIDSVRFDRDRIAIQRGPILYCVEGADNNEGVWNLFMPSSATFTGINYKILDEPVIALQAEVNTLMPNKEGSNVEVKKRKITAIPYYCWANRGNNSMQVWLPTKISDVKINYQSKFPDGGNY